MSPLLKKKYSQGVGDQISIALLKIFTDVELSTPEIVKIIFTPHPTVVLST